MHQYELEADPAKDKTLVATPVAQSFDYLTNS
jgi:hypothetical protein